MTEVTIASCDVLLRSVRYSPEEVWTWPGGVYRGWTTAFVRVTSTDGELGLGEIGDGLNVPAAATAVFEQLAPRLVGRAARPSALVPALERGAPGWGHGGLAASVISGIEMAVVDLLGRSLGQPAHVLVGGAHRDELPVYASGGLTDDPDELHDEVASYVKAGYRAVKIRIGHGLELDTRRVAAARDAVGSDVRLMADFGASYLPEPPTMNDMVRLARRLEPFDLAWLEEPLPRHDFVGHARLRRETSIPIAAGESERSLDGVHRMLDAGAVDVIQTDAAYIGGVLRQIEIGRLAAQAGARLAPHTWGSGPALMANATAVACSPAGLIVEVPQVPNRLRDESLAEQFRPVDGVVPLPATPGLGVTLTDRTDSRDYDPEAGPALHLGAA